MSTRIILYCQYEILDPLTLSIKTSYLVAIFFINQTNLCITSVDNFLNTIYIFLSIPPNILYVPTLSNINVDLRIEQKMCFFVVIVYSSVVCT